MTIEFRNEKLFASGEEGSFDVGEIGKVGRRLGRDRQRIGTVGSAVSPMFGSAFNAHSTLASVSRNLLTVNTPVTLRPR
jgi:hypothetical protein